MRTPQDIVDMVQKYRDENPDLKTKVSLESIEALEALHGPGRMDEVYDTIEKAIEEELAIRQLVKFGVPFEEAVKQVFSKGGSADDEGPIEV